jgi:hypothetical protein
MTTNFENSVGSISRESISYDLFKTLTTIDEEIEQSVEQITDRFKKSAFGKGQKSFDNWLKTRRSIIERIGKDFDENGRPKIPLSATTFNDLYKWTMTPVIRQCERMRNESIVVTFGVDLRDRPMRDAIKNHPELQQAIYKGLLDLQKRLFNRDEFIKVLSSPREGILDNDSINMICMNGNDARQLVDGVVYFDNGINSDKTNIDKIRETDGKVVNLYMYYKDDKYYKGNKNEKGMWFIEASGPWHKVTWLETSMMQAVYEAYLRWDLKKKYPHKTENEIYAHWLREALLRCAYSVEFTQMVQRKFPSMVTPALFTGRRTGGYMFLILQNLYFADNFDQFEKNKTLIGTTTFSLGTSSVDSYLYLDRIRGDIQDQSISLLNPAGTHAHELSMVCSILYPLLDNNVNGLPLSQIISHYMYYRLVWEKCKPTERGPMPMLPDTLGTPAFMFSASIVSVNNLPFLNLIQSARQDSGRLSDFKHIMKKFGYTGGCMASEVDNLFTLVNAAKMGYGSAGAGGFFGDSPKVWNEMMSNVSMAVKAVRVEYRVKDETEKKLLQNLHNFPHILIESDRVVGYPIKIGDAENLEHTDLKEGKLSVDNNLSETMIDQMKNWAEKRRTDSYLLMNQMNELPKPILEISSFFTGDKNDKSSGYVLDQITNNDFFSPHNTGFDKN